MTTNDDSRNRGPLSRPLRGASRRTGLSAVVAAVVLAAATACGGSTAATDEAPPEGGELFPINVIDTKTAIDLPLYAGIDSGAFEAAGLDVTISDAAKSPSEGMPLLLNGSLTLMIAEIHGAMLARSEGMPIKMTTPVFVGSEPENDPLGFGNILSLKESGIDSPEELEGKKVAVNGIGEQPWLEANVVLERAGVDVSKVEWVSILVPQMPAALNQGQVDAIVVPEPLSTMVVQEGTANAVVSLDDAFVGTPRFAYMATEESLAENPEAFRKFTEVFLEQGKILNADRDARIEAARAHLELPDPVYEEMATPVYATEALTAADVELWAEQIVKWKLAPDKSNLPAADEVIFSGK